MSSLIFLFVVLAFGAAVGVIALVVVSISRTQRAAEQRRQQLVGLANEREWGFRPQDPSLVDRFAGPPFERGRSRQATNVIVGQYDGRPFTAFDYAYTTGSGDSTQRHTCSVVALNLGVSAPDLSIGPTTMMRRWVDAITGNDILIGDPEFDDFFTVHSPSPEFAADVLLSDVRDVMRHHAGVAWRITGDSLLVIRDGHHGPGEVEAKLRMMDALLDRVPARVWDRLRGEAPR